MAFLPEYCHTKVEAILDGEKLADMKVDSYISLNVPSGHVFIQLCMKSERNTTCILSKVY